ncbi:MAG: YidC/Oxa1 family membrane protein insertase [Chloroflexota bacterium]
MWDTLIINPMLNALLWIYSMLGNFGLTIIVFTIFIRLLTHPLMVSQIRGQQKLQDFQSSDRMKELQKKYKDNKQMMQQEQAKLLQEAGINPFSSCLPLLIQFPIIIGLYQVITRAMATTPLQMEGLYQHLYPFTDIATLMPVNNHFLWMNLGQPERLYIGSIGIPTLAILVVVTTFLQSKLMTPPAQPGADQSAQMTQGMMNIYMPLLMGWLAWSFASGLALYFVTSNLVSIFQYALLGKLNINNLLPAGLRRSSESAPQPKRPAGRDELGPGMENPQPKSSEPKTTQVRARKRKGS